MATGYAVNKVQLNGIKAFIVPIAAFLLGVVMLASIALLTGWRSDAVGSPSPTVQPGGAASGQLQDCRLGRAC